MGPHCGPLDVGACHSDPELTLNRRDSGKIAGGRTWTGMQLNGKKKSIAESHVSARDYICIY